MKFTIDRFTISISDKHIKSFKAKKVFIEEQSKVLAHTKIDVDVLSDKLGQIYDTLVPPKEEKKDK